jgi:hypothetical protein
LSAYFAQNFAYFAFAPDRLKAAKPLHGSIEQTMLGPRPLDFWTPNGGDPFGHLLPGRRYRVSQAFFDYEGEEHPVGEEWTYLGHNFLPYEDGLSLFVSLDGEQAWHIRMQWTEEAQGAILDDLENYITDAQALSV